MRKLGKLVNLERKGMELDEKEKGKRKKDLLGLGISPRTLTKTRSIGLSSPKISSKRLISFSTSLCNCKINCHVSCIAPASLMTVKTRSLLSSGKAVPCIPSMQNPNQQVFAPWIRARSHDWVRKFAVVQIFAKTFLGRTGVSEVQILVSYLIPST